MYSFLIHLLLNNRKNSHQHKSIRGNRAASYPRSASIRSRLRNLRLFSLTFAEMCLWSQFFPAPFNTKTVADSWKVCCFGIFSLERIVCDLSIKNFFFSDSKTKNIFTAVKRSGISFLLVYFILSRREELFWASHFVLRKLVKHSYPTKYSKTTFVDYPRVHLGECNCEIFKWKIQVRMCC